MLVPIGKSHSSSSHSSAFQGSNAMDTSQRNMQMNEVTQERHEEERFFQAVKETLNGST